MPPDTHCALLEQGFRLIHADQALIVADKPSGLLSVPGRGPDKQDCLSKRVQADYPDALIVHRLDFDTSGLLVLARGKGMHRRLSILFQERQVNKRYIAVVKAKNGRKPTSHSGWLDIVMTIPGKGVSSGLDGSLKRCGAGKTQWRLTDRVRESQEFRVQQQTFGLFSGFRIGVK